MDKKSTVLIYGTNLGGYKAAYALCKKGYKTILLNRGSYVDEFRNQVLSQLPYDFCWICGHMPQRLFKSIGCLSDNYNAELLSVSGEAGNFRVKFKKKDQIVNNFACAECDKCIEVCPVEVGNRKAIWVKPEVAWENIYLIDWGNCTLCGKCEEVCPTGALKLERPEETIEAEVGAIVLAPEFDEPGTDDLEIFAYGSSPSVVKNSEIARKSLLTNFISDSVRLPSGKIPTKFGIIVTPHFNKPGVEYENQNLSVTAVYRGMKLRETIPESTVTVFLKDYRAFGKSQYRWYQKAIESGVEIVRTDSLKVRAEEEEEVTIDYDGQEGHKTIKVEMAILVTGQKPPEEMENLSKLCGVKPDNHGFCNIRPHSSVETDVDGIFAVGEFSGPKGNPETIWDGCATLTEILKYLGKPSFAPSPSPQLRNVEGEERRVGVFICSCFGTFNDKIDLDKLRNLVNELPGVSHAEIIEGCCTPPTMKDTAEKIKAAKVNRVVLAVCTPLQKLLKYRKTVMMAGLNPLLTEYVRLREDVINVHRDQDKMLVKALSLIRSAVEKTRLGSQAPTLKGKFTPQALVIGGGSTGSLCAMELSANGFQVHLVEKEKELGGNSKYLAADDKKYVESVIEKIQKSPLVTIHTESEVTEVDGYAGNFQARIKTPGGHVDIESGVIFVATGADEYQPTGFLYGTDPRVVTQAELKEKVAAGASFRRVVMIQCVGSRNDEHPYCSRVCCDQALENAIQLQQNGSSVTILYRDMTSFHPADLYRKAGEIGVKFIRFTGDAYPEVKQDKDALLVTIPGGGGKLAADLVVLSTGIVPDKSSNERLAEILNYPLDPDGFFDSDANSFPYEEAIKKVTKPFELATNGIFPVGLAHSPRSFKDSLLTVQDALGRALVVLGKGSLPPPNAMYIAGVKESLCMGCGVCIDACPYAARHIDPIKKIAVVRPFLCDSCGSCVAICPNDASYLRDFTGSQSIAMIDSVLI